MGRKKDWSILLILIFAHLALASGCGQEADVAGNRNGLGKIKTDTPNTGDILSIEVAEGVVGINGNDSNPPKDDNTPPNGSTTVPSTPIAASCDLPDLSSIVTQHCSSCHANGNAIGGFSVEGSASWDASSKEAALAVHVINSGTMPPQGLPRLDQDAMAVVNACKQSGQAVEVGSSGTASVDTDCSGEVPDLPGAARTRILSRIELENTIKSLVGTLTSDLSQALALVPSRTPGSWFSSQTDKVSASHLDAFMVLAEAVAKTFSNSLDLQKKIASCLGSSSTAATASCRDASLTGLASAFLRRPASVSEMTSMRALWDAGVGTSAQEALKLVIQYLVQSPGFLYLSYSGVPGTPDQKAELTSYELASRLSYWLWKGPPDAVLMSLAEQDRLKDPKVLAAEVDRLLDDPRAHDALQLFVREWLDLDNLSPLPTDSGFLQGIQTAGLSDLMREEVITFGAEIIQTGGTYSDLMTSRRSKASGDLASLYGVSASEGSSSFIELPQAERAGILTRAALHVRGVKSSPFHMAKLVQERVVGCTSLPLPPAGAAAAVEQEGASTPMSYRQKFEVATLQTACVGCHNQLNGYAFGFQYDAIGRFRTMENLIDSTGSIVSTVPIDRKVNVFTGRVASATQVDGPVALSKFLAGSEKSQRCFLTQVVRFADGRQESVSEGCQIDRARRLGGANVRDQIKALVTSSAFRFRDFGK